MIAPVRFVVENLAKASGRVHLPVTARRLEFVDPAEFAALPDGTVVLGHTRWYLSNVLIWGFWKHAAIKSGGRIVEAIGKGVVETPIGDWLAERDAACALVPLFGSTAEAKAVADLADTQVGKPYDWEFDVGSKAFYCAELVFWAYKRIFPDMGFELRERLGRPTVTPQDFADATKYWRTVLTLPVASE